MENSHLIYDLSLLTNWEHCHWEYALKTLEVMQEEKIKSEVTDLALLTGGTNNFMLLDNADEVKTIDEYYQLGSTTFSDRSCVIRPTIRFKIMFRKLLKDSYIDDNGLVCVEYGEYPQTAASTDLQNKLEESYEKGQLKNTEESYTFNCINSDDKENNLNLVNYNVYQYNSKKYIRMKASGVNGKKIKLSNGEEYNEGDHVWIEVEPVKWLMDKRSEIMFSLKGLVSGVGRTYLKDMGNSFYTTEVKTYMDHYMTNDLFQVNGLTFEDFSYDDIKIRMGSIDGERRSTVRRFLENRFNNISYIEFGTYFNDGRFYFISKMDDKYHLSRDIMIFLAVNFDEIFHRHGKFEVEKWGFNRSCCNALLDDDLKQGECYLKVLDEEYINTVKEIFRDSNLSISDYMNLVNMGKYDLDALAKTYSGISPNKIKDIILRGGLKDNIYSLFEKLNDKSDDYQTKVLKLINPIINEVIGDDFAFSSYTRDLKYFITGRGRHSEFMKDHIKNGGDEGIRLYNEIPELKREKVNIYFLKEFENLFMDFFLNCSENISMDVLDKVLKLRDYVIKNMPKSYWEKEYETKIVKEPGKVMGRISFDGNYSEVKRTVSTDVLVLSRQKVLKIKKTVLILLPMIINNDYCNLYEELLKVDLDSKYILGLIETLKSNENDKTKVKQIKPNATK